MPIYWSKTDSRWRFEFDRRIESRRYRLTKLLPKGWSKAQAERYEQHERNRLYAESKGLEKGHASLAGAVALYLEHRIPKLKNGKKAAQDLAQLCEHIESHRLDQVCELAKDYQTKNAGKLAPATIHNRLAYLKAAVRYAFKHHHYGDRDHTGGMALPSVSNERQVYARLPELNKLWRALDDPEARALFKMDFYMGLRWRAELLTRKSEHVIRNRRDVWLQIGETKNGQPVMKPVHPAIMDCLRFIPFKHGDTYFYKHWRAAAEKIGRPDLKPHDLRHSLASEVLSRKGGNLDMVRSALHHQSLQAAKRYAHLYPEAAKAVILGIGGRKTPQSSGAKRKAAGGK